jgi:hypothetical protein
MCQFTSDQMINELRKTLGFQSFLDEGAVESSL